MPQSPACPLPDPSLFFLFFLFFTDCPLSDSSLYFFIFFYFTDPSLFFYIFLFVLIFITIIIFSPDQKIQVTCHLRHEPRTMGPTTTTGLQPPQSGTPGRGQHLRRRARPQGNREERTGTVGTPAATPPNLGGSEERTGTVGTPAATPPNPGGGEGRTGAAGTPAAAPPNRVVRDDKTGAADTPAAAPPKQVCREGRTGAVTEVTEGEGRTALGVVLAAEGANPAASGAASTSHNARGTLQGHPNGTDAPIRPRTASGTNENLPTSATPCTLPKEPPQIAVGSPGHPEGTRKGAARSVAKTPPPTGGGDRRSKPLPH